MSDLVRFEAGSGRWLSVIRDQMAPGASEEDLAYFGQVCRRLALSPFAGQVALIGRWDRKLARQVHRPQITVAGRRALAWRTGRLAGVDGPVWCGPRDPAGAELVWREVWDDDDAYPYCARALVYVKGWDRPANGTAKWSEFSQWYDGDDHQAHLVPLWSKMPSHMLGKVAESLALRRAFPEVAEAVAEVDADDETATLDPDPVAPAVTRAGSSEPPARLLDAVETIDAKRVLLAELTAAGWPPERAIVEGRRIWGALDPGPIAGDTLAGLLARVEPYRDGGR
jgi:hypothetical protein